MLRQLRRKRILGISLGTVLVLVVAIAAFVVNFLPAENNPIPEKFGVVPQVEASCTIFYNADYYQEGSNEETEELTLIITLPDGTPLVGVCLTFTRDRGLGEPPEVIGSCTTDDEGRCIILTPGGLISVHFGNTKVGGIPVSNGDEMVDLLNDASPGGISYYFPGDEPAEQNIVASASDDGGSIVMEHAKENEDGELEPIDPGPGAPDNGWDLWNLPDIGIVTLPPWILDEDPIFNTTIPEGIVTVRFVPTILRTSGAYDRAYCYYANGNSGFARIPPEAGTFLPGGGSYFDLGAVMNGEARPGQVLQAETDSFNILLECWGWQGANLVKIGTTNASEGRDFWLGQPLQMSGGGLSVNYALGWYGPEVQPTSPRLTDIQTLEDYVPPSGGVIADNAVGVGSTRFADSLRAPDGVTLEGDVVAWNYAGDSETEIGGFRIYRNNYLIGFAPQNARSWTGDGVGLLECGQPIEFRVTTYAGGQESVPSEPASVEGPDCVANVVVTLSTLEISNMQDCDGEACSPVAEAYGYIMVNDVVVVIGTNNRTLGLENKAYDLAAFLAPFGVSNQIMIGLNSTDTLNVEVGLFDRDTDTTDDLICTWQEILPSRDAAGWQEQDGRVITRAGTSGEGDCSFTIGIGVLPAEIATEAEAE